MQSISKNLNFAEHFHKIFFNVCESLRYRFVKPIFLLIKKGKVFRVRTISYIFQLKLYAKKERIDMYISVIFIEYTYCRLMALDNNSLGAKLFVCNVPLDICDDTAFKSSF